MITGLSVTLTATQLITERKEGVIDRTWVAGVSVFVLACSACVHACIHVVCACVCTAQMLL